MSKESKVIGKYNILLIETYDVGGYDSKLNWKKGTLRDGEVAVFIHGKKKGLIKRHNYSGDYSRKLFNKLNNVNKIEKWLKVKVGKRVNLKTLKEIFLK